MAVKNDRFNGAQKPDLNVNFVHSKAYVVKFHIPQRHQTPSLAHFGHAIFDGLLPFCIMYLKGGFARAVPTPNKSITPASIYVLDIGLFLLPLLRSIFPEIHFIGFWSLSQLPRDEDVAEAHLYGVGMPL